ncbi:putative 50S ribosomal protein L6, chloroplastic-like [Capsicum annuum]|jgi:isopenicillin N synthase-like dioxygenase|uniref:Isopenicillin N synthase-like Fe(2+) 2OG dioxygenase domain-containing protein n=1 Tax=Capsicum annuum TaxID=4072 RepID=A0A2G2YBJ6_CAPAN|nr:probable 2-oxoglutarate-dependent dioxygenase AOP1 [Capsicum annuum]KAF3651378.1 putative 50S ribosomal protein L6, chloroplastic-like [Capsicum annuum]KAF3664509.1 putative 50S ribosomal protein L6, chloroplastic-like [Capsicum annuum]PHT67079.1 hypothetical protein T459_31504 [Capsicum annuum]
MGVFSAPKIDFGKSSELKKGSEKWNLLRDEVFKALEEYGCFEALLDGEIPKVKLYEKLKEVFNFNLEKIFGNTQSVLVGYDRYKPKAPLQERLVIPNVLNDGVIENFSKNLWPDGESEFSDLVLTYSKKLSEFDDLVKRMVFEKLGLEKYLDEHKKSGDYLLAMIKYRAPKAGETNVGIPPHTDNIISTILSQHDQDGLQILDKNGQWLDVQFSTPNSYVFLVSDCLKAFTNGRLNCLIHRVIIGNEERYSVGFPLIPKEGYIIKVPEELVDENHPLLYKPFDGSKLLPFYMAEGRRGVSATLEDFCGVSTNNPNLS